jgi:hypothetical protein
VPAGNSPHPSKKLSFPFSFDVLDVYHFLGEKRVIIIVFAAKVLLEGSVT